MFKNVLFVLLNLIMNEIDIKFINLYMQNNQQNDDKEHQSIITYVKNNQDADA